jgi:Fur family transcriptional regulator, ferric uptake regulator
MVNNDLKTKAEAILKTAGFNSTKAQIFILQELLSAAKPLSREELSTRLGENCPDKVTVYRIMERFCGGNLVHKVYLGNRAWNYELAHHCEDKQCHPHFTCNNCGQTYCLTGLFLPMVKGLKKGFVVQRQQVGIEGLCSSCS